MISKSLDKVSFNREVKPSKSAISSKKPFNEGTYYKAISKTLMGSNILLVFALIILGLNFSNYVSKEKIIVKDSSQTSGIYQKGQLKKSIMEREVKKYLHLWGNVDFDSVDSSFSELYRNMSPELKGRIKVQFTKFAHHLKEKKIIFSSSISEFKLVQNQDGSFQAEARLYKKVFENDVKARPLEEVIAMKLILNRDSEIQSLIPIHKFKVYSKDQYLLECEKCLLR